MDIWIDTEDLFDYARHNARPSGIQRLCFELYEALMARPDASIGFVRHSRDGQRLEVIPWKDVRDLYLGLINKAGSGASAVTTIDSAAPLPPQRRRRLVGNLPLEVRRPLAQAYHAQRQALSSGFEAVRSVPALWRRASGEAEAAAGDLSVGEDLRQVARPGDVLCCFGSPWFQPGYADLIASVTGECGLRFAMLIYDLIPLLSPEFCDRHLIKMFSGHTRACLPLADAVFTISEATARDVESWAKREAIALRCPPRAIPIGTGFAHAPATALPPELTPGEYVLFVSTIEARKNHVQAFRIWRRMLSEMPWEAVPKLVFAGRVGWMVADLMQAIENSDWLQGKLVLVREPDDGTLSALYQSCRFTLFTSLYEGWGLPVSESLSFGKMCIASDRASVPEAGGEFCLYVDPENTTAAYDVVRQAIEHPEQVAAMEERIRRDYQPTSWSATASAILSALQPG